MEKVLITVVSASWNQGQYAEKCINSINEKFRNRVEHLVIDNCSDDETHEVLKKYPHVRTIIEPDKGQSEALNKGFRAAKGEWILWLNLDDYLLPGALEKYLESIDCSGDRLDMVYGHMLFVDAENETIKRVIQPRWYYWMTAFGGYVAPSTGSLYRRELFTEHPLDEKFHMIMDTEWMLRSGRNIRVKRLNISTVAFRLADNKTAEHVNSGVVTPQHQIERDLLSKRYIGYPNIEPIKIESFTTLKQSIRRKIVRAWVLIDKGITRVRLLRAK